MEVYFSVQQDPIPTSPAYFSQQLITISSDIGSFMRCTHYYTPTPLPSNITPVLFMYQVELSYFDKLIISQIRQDGIPLKGSNIVPIGVKSAGSCIYLSEDHRIQYFYEMIQNNVNILSKYLAPRIRGTWKRFLKDETLSPMEKDTIRKLMGHPSRPQGEQPTKPGLSSGI